MVVELSRVLPDDSLSRFRIYDMRPDEIIEVSCDNVAEFNTAKRNANFARDNSKRMDGYQYKIETDSYKNTIRVSLFKDQKEESEVKNE